MRLKAKFRPNLADAGNRSARIRRISGTSDIPIQASKRIRTISGGSNQGSNRIRNEVLSPLGSPPVSPMKSPRKTMEPFPTSQESVLASPPPVDRPDSIESPDFVMRSPTGSRDPDRSPEYTTMPSPARLSSDMRPFSRQRRLTETKSESGFRAAEKSMAPTKEIITQPASIFDRRKADHKRKFVNGQVPDRHRMTMFDLIYYNPLDGSKMSNSSSRRTSRASISSDRSINETVNTPETLESVKKRLEEEAVDDAPGQDEEEEVDEQMPVPQVKVGANGEIILDEESTIIETTAAKKAKQELLKSPLVFENSNVSSNYGTWGKKRKSLDWGDRETVRFYKALSVFGTDFSMMESVFKKRSRQELKLKFKKEERQNRALVDKCLKEGMQFDTSIFGSDAEDDENAENDATKKTKSKPRLRKKRRVRKVVSNRGYYSGSDEADLESEATNSETEPKSTLASQNLTSGSAASSTTSPLLKTLLSKPTTPSSDSSFVEPSSASSPMAFPPGLLAANPGLANAQPGSLVVVASPARDDPEKQMLHVFQVTDEQAKKDGDQASLEKQQS